MRKAILAGTFDPVTNGHLDIIKRASALYDELHVVIGINPEKKPMFYIETRMSVLSNSLDRKVYSNVVISPFSGLLSEYAYNNGIRTIIRGLRNPSDFEYELTLSSVNRDIRGIETMFMPSKPEFFNVSSSMVKAIVKEGGNVEKYVPLEAKCLLERKIGNYSLVGVVGNSGSGKSTFTKNIMKSLFPSTTGINDIRKYCVIDLDEVTHEIYDSELPYCLEVKEKIAAHFGEDVMDRKNHTVNRKVLGKLVFGKVSEMAVLNEIMKNPLRHAVYERIKKGMSQFNMYSKKVPVFIEGAIIPQQGFLPLVNNNVIYFECDERLAAERIAKRDNIDINDANRRLLLQTRGVDNKKIIRDSIIYHRFGEMIESDGTIDYENPGKYVF